MRKIRVVARPPNRSDWNIPHLSALRISTVIPAYNRADLVGETLRTVLSQSRAPDEVIVVDDGSSDGTRDVVAAFGPEVTLICQANAGAGPARNAGFARSTGDIIHFMDSDDLCSLNFYERAASRIEAGADMTYGPWLKTRVDGNCLHPEPLVLQQSALPLGQRMDVLTLTVEWYTVFQPCLFRRELVERAGPYRSDLKPSEDTELLYRLTAAARNIVHVPEILILYRVHPEDQVSEQNHSRRLVDRAHLWLTLREHLAERSDIGWRERRTFRVKSLFVALEAMAHDPAKAIQLMRDTRWHDRLSYGLNHLRNRVRVRSGRSAPADRNALLQSPAPLRIDQRALVGELGYTFANGGCRAG